MTLGLVLLLGCDPTAVDPNALSIAVVLPLSGSFASNGEPHRAALQMAIRDLEAAGGVQGRSIRAELIDCGDNMETAIDRVNKTLGSPTAAKLPVRAVISSTTACNQASLYWALQAKVPHLEVSSGSDQDELIDDPKSPVMPSSLDRSYEFQVRALCNTEAEMTPDFIALRPEMRRVVIMRGTHGHDVMHTSTVRQRFPSSEFAAKGGVVLNADDIVMTDNGYKEKIAEALALMPDTIYFHHNGDTRNVDFFAELERANFAGKIITCGMSAKNTLLDPVTPGVIDYLGGKLFFMMRGPVGGETLSAFKEEYKAFYGKEADTFAASAYDAAMLVGLGLAASSSDSGESLRDAIHDVAKEGAPFKYGQTPEALDALRSGTNINYEGASGSLDFKDDNSVPSKYFVTEVKFDATTSKGSFKPLPSPEVFR